MASTMRTGINLTLALILALSSPLYVFAQEIGKITYVEGRVDISTTEEGMASPAREELAVSVGD